MTDIVLSWVLIADVSGTLLVDGVVRQVDERVRQRLRADLIRFGSEANEALLVNIDAERIEGGDCHIKSDIEFVLIDEIRVRDVSADDQMRIPRDRLERVGDEDASPLTRGVRFDDPEGRAILKPMKSVVEAFGFLRQKERLGN